MKPQPLTLLALTAITVCVALHNASQPELTHAFRPDSPSVLVPSASAGDILRAHPAEPGREYGGADWVSYLRAAILINSEGTLDWAYARLWPPGQPALAALVLSVGGDTAYAQKMILLAAVFWSLALGLLVLLAARDGRALLPIAVYAAVFWFVAPSLAAFTFGFGAVMTEATSSALFIAGAALLLHGFCRRRLLLASAGGACFGFAALLRPYFELMVLHPLLALGLVALGLAAWRAKSLAPPKTALVAFGLACVLASASGQGVTAPYRIGRALAFGSGQLSNFDQLTTWAFAEDEELPGFHHGGNAACHVEPELCALVRAHKGELRPSLVRKMVFMTLLSRPGRWLAFKLSFFDQLWFGRPFAALGLVEWLEGALLLGLGLASIARLGARALVRRAAPEELALLVWVIVFITANAGGLALFQFEWRYSQALRAGAYYLPLLSIIARPKP